MNASTARASAREVRQLSRNVGRRVTVCLSGVELRRRLSALTHVERRTKDRGSSRRRSRGRQRRRLKYLFSATAGAVSGRRVAGRRGGRHPRCEARQVNDGLLRVLDRVVNVAVRFTCSTNVRMLGTPAQGRNVMAHGRRAHRRSRGSRPLPNYTVNGLNMNTDYVKDAVTASSGLQGRAESTRRGRTSSMRRSGNYTAFLADRVERTPCIARACNAADNDGGRSRLAAGAASV